MTQTLKASISVYSDRGVKKHNEDAAGSHFPEEPLLTTKGLAVVIADGVSSSEAGGEASQLSVNGFLQDYFSTPDSWTVKTSGAKVLHALNRWLHGLAQQRYESYKGLVTTFSGMVIKSNTAHIFHIGDSRIYRLQNGTLEPLTTDHRIRIEGDRDQLSRAFGIDINADIDYKTFTVEKGDLFLFSTDGMHDFIPNKQLSEVIKKHANHLELLTQSLGKLALSSGSDDNITCIALHIDELPSEDENEFYNQLAALPFPPDLQPGMSLDGYKVIRELHATNHTQLYLATDPNTGDDVVLKTPSVNFEDDPTYIDMFVHEEWIGKRIDNAHVMKVCPLTTKRKFLYYVAEFIPGQSLRQWMNDNPNPTLNDVRRIIGQIARGLRAFHRLEMIHQDLKPENIMLDEHGTVKIIDFGSTKIAGIAEIKSPIEHGTLIGTEGFIAPEYHRNEPASNQSDIFSLGVIAYQMLTGKLPYGKPLNKRLVDTGLYVPAVEFNAEVPRWMDAAIRKAVHLQTAKRYELLSEFTHDISNPNNTLLDNEQQPLLERNPVSFWKTLSLLLFLLNLFLLYSLSAN